jgi:hypothetical protein
VPIPPDRLTPLNAAPLEPTRDLVLYWCVMARRTTYNFALQHAVETARALGRPLVVLEALRAGYRGPTRGCTASRSTGWPTTRRRTGAPA